ncbi:MAG TPA: hypothetical protein VIL92_00065 [Gaiellaceae bacterium]
MAATIDETVASGFKLGWLVGHLYHDTRSLAARPTTAPPAQLPPRLPDPSGLPGNGYAKLQLAQTKREHDTLVAAGLTLTGTDDLETALDAADKSGDERRAALYTLDATWLTELAAQRFTTSRAYQLGRSLQDTTHAQASDNSLDELFNRYRISELSSWLDDLEPQLPANSAFAVKSSLHAWTRWVEQHAPPPPRQDRDTQTDAPPLSTPEPHPEPTPEPTPTTSIAAGEDPTAAQLRGTLYRQGTIWFSLLGSNTDPFNFVIAENYVDAAKALLHRTTNIGQGISRRWWIAMTMVVVGVIALVAIAAATLSGGSRAATIIAAILAGAGVSWKAVGATIGATVKRLEHPLWNAEQRLAVAAAATRLPSDDKASGRPPAIHT